MLVILLTLFISTPTLYSHAADTKGNYAIWGEGSLSCHQFSKSRKAKDDALLKAYLRGYLTAYNTLTTDTYRITGKMNLPQVLTWLDEYCDKKAIDSFDRAIQMLLTEIANKRYRTSISGDATKGWGQK